MLRYVKRTLNHKLASGRGANELKNFIIGYSDTDYARCMDPRKLVFGYVFTIFEGVVSWKCSLKKVVDLSIIKEEFMATTEVMEEGLWMQKMFKELGFV